MDMFLSNILTADKKVPQDRNLPWVFTDKPVTAWGGLRLVKGMLIRMDFRKALVNAFFGDRHRIALVRADSGFFGGDFLKMLESKFIRYIVAVRMNPVVRSMVSGLSNWISVDEGITVSEMSYQAHSWEKARRVIVVRQDEEIRPDARGKFLLDIPGCRYQLYVTDFYFAPAEFWRLYRSPADSENRIGELKIGLSGFCLASFWATEAAFHSVLLAYNIMSLFRQAVLHAPKAVRLLTMRFQCFALGAWVGRRGRKKVLRINVPWKKRPWFEEIGGI